jgi:hypothetical protein
MLETLHESVQRRHGSGERFNDEASGAARDRGARGTRGVAPHVIPRRLADEGSWSGVAPFYPWIPQSLSLHRDDRNAR